LAEITYREGDEISKMSENEIIEKTIEEDDVILTLLYRFKYAYIIYDLNYKENLVKIFKYLKAIGIDSIGRFGSWEYANMDAVIRMVKDYVSSCFNHNPKLEWLERYN